MPPEEGRGSRRYSAPIHPPAVWFSGASPHASRQLIKTAGPEVTVERLPSHIGLRQVQRWWDGRSDEFPAMSTPFQTERSLWAQQQGGHLVGDLTELEYSSLCACALVRGVYMRVRPGQGQSPIDSTEGVRGFEDSTDGCANPPHHACDFLDAAHSSPLL